MPDTGSVRIVGRADWSDPAGPRFCWSGTTILARFTGSSVAVRLRDRGNFFEVTLDGKRRPVLAATGERETYPLASGLAAGPHELALHRRTEASVGETQFLGLVLDPDGALLPPPAPAERRLEFIGDSITCGYGVEAPNQYVGFSPATENHQAAFAALTARALGAEAISVAYSGKGVLRNYDGGTEEPMPVLYERVLLTSPVPWDFGAWIPQAVIINLGANDFGQGDPGPAFGDAYRRFLKQVRGHHREALLLCALGPVMSSEQMRRARGYLMPAVQADPRASFLEFPHQDGSLGYGSDWHPSKGTQRTLADRLVPELRRLLGW